MRREKYGSGRGQSPVREVEAEIGLGLGWLAAVDLSM